MTRIVVTGAAGFIGRALARSLAARGCEVTGLVRAPAPAIPGVRLEAIGTIGPQSRWHPHLQGAEIVVHLATRAHGSRRPGGAEAASAGALVRAAAACGVRRLVHMSSLRAMGAATVKGAPFRAADPPRPPDPYGCAKLAIVRPPLVYGPAVKGNLQALLRLVAAGVPLPFAGIDNRRSLVFLDNLVDLTIRACLDPAACGRVLLVRDIDLSTPELVRALAAGLGRRARLFPLPGSMLAAAQALPALGPLVARLTASLEADDRETRALLGWVPPFSPAAGLAATARAFAARS